MTSINLQFMLFFKPLSVHSRSIMWRPDEREKKGKIERGRGKDAEKDNCYMTDNFSKTRKSELG